MRRAASLILTIGTAVAVLGLGRVHAAAHHYDYLATVLHLFGLDAKELVYKQNARSETILDGQPGKVVEGILA